VCSPHGASGAPWGILTMSVPPYCGTKIYRMVAMLSVYASARFSGCEFSSTGEAIDRFELASCSWRDLKRETRAGAGIATAHPRFLRAHPSDHLQSTITDPLNTTDLRPACCCMCALPFDSWFRTIWERSPSLRCSVTFGWLLDRPQDEHRCDA
jgi:hypothetical protein